MGDIFFNRTVTVFNQSASNDVLKDDEWYPTVLHGVRLRETHGANISTSGLADADSAKLHVMMDNLEKPYLEPIIWNDLLDKTEAFTFAQDRDFFVVGDVSDESTTASDFYSYMKKKYDGVYKITNVDKYDIIPHFEVGGK